MALHSHRRWTWLGPAIWLTAASPVAAGTPLQPFTVVGDAVPKSLTGRPGNAQRGRAIVTDRRVGLCVLCHSGPFPEVRLQGTLAPDLAGSGRRLTEGQLRLRIVDASLSNPDTIMPPYYRIERLDRVLAKYRNKPVLTAAEIEDVVAFLMTLKE
jgi:L-cysteine S-thiosulfotransferase